MNLSNVSRKLLVDEFEYVAHRLKKESEIPNKLYFYSGTYAVVNRVFNIEFDPNLVLIHNVLQSSYTQINNAFNVILEGRERVIMIPEGLFGSLAQSLLDLANMIAEDGDITTPLGKIAACAYTTTGNGYYLHQKGILKL